jgi:hypothetical protein
MRRSTLLILVASAGVMNTIQTAAACPACCHVEVPPLSELADTFQLVMLAEWTGAEKGGENEPGWTNLKVVACRPTERLRLKAGAAVSLPDYYKGRPGELFLVIGGNPGVEGGLIDAEQAEPSTRTLYRYLCGLPADQSDRLRYHLRHLEHADETVADDAHRVLSLLPFDELAALRNDLPRERLRRWVADPQTNVTRVGLYGTMLGVCGEEADAKLLGQIALGPVEDFRLGIYGVMFGYLLLAGEDGLRRLEQAKFAQDAGVPFSETYAALHALRSMWDHGGGRIAPARLRQSMRLLLDRPEIADLAIMDLARWKDWEVQDRLIRLYDDEDYDIPAVKRAIVRYLLAAAHDPAFDPDGNHDRHVIEARRQIEHLRQIDPDTVRKIERFTVK